MTFGLFGPTAKFSPGVTFGYAPRRTRMVHSEAFVACPRAVMEHLEFHNLWHMVVYPVELWYKVECVQTRVSTCWDRAARVCKARTWYKLICRRTVMVYCQVVQCPRLELCFKAHSRLPTTRTGQHRRDGFFFFLICLPTGTTAFHCTSTSYFCCTCAESRGACSGLDDLPWCEAVKIDCMSPERPGDDIMRSGMSIRDATPNRCTRKSRRRTAFGLWWQIWLEVSEAASHGTSRRKTSRMWDSRPLLEGARGPLSYRRRRSPLGSRLVGSLTCEDRGGKLEVLHVSMSLTTD